MSALQDILHELAATTGRHHLHDLIDGLEQPNDTEEVQDSIPESVPVQPAEGAS